MNSRTLLWAIPLVLYLVFAWWYTNTEGPLTEQEIQRFMQELPTFGFEGERLERIRTFMENDTGRQFIMINNIDLNEDPPSVEGAPDGATASDLMGMYMEYMWPALLQRACHPIFMGVTVFDSMDIVGIENAEVWDQGALMRYRSRRDLFEIISNPEFQGRHDFKMAGLVKTIAYPVETRLYFSDPRLLLALILITLTSLLDLWIYRRRD
ncbi:MAG: hypothetical protein JJ957_11610 [Pseudomonadales bacterium]|nr:hypothetical protein [Pseudomonadales bacterium]MBO6595853.1 hypothetical protein [Pseudomonadales bacterium]MBO6822337.1 hypothetical protein [Pseudomonadales bacterium]